PTAAAVRRGIARQIRASDGDGATAGNTLPHPGQTAAERAAIPWHFGQSFHDRPDVFIDSLPLAASGLEVASQGLTIRGFDIHPGADVRKVLLAPVILPRSEDLHVGEEWVGLELQELLRAPQRHLLTLPTIDGEARPF